MAKALVQHSTSVGLGDDLGHAATPRQEAGRVKTSDETMRPALEASLPCRAQSVGPYAKRGMTCLAVGRAASGELSAGDLLLPVVLLCAANGDLARLGSLRLRHGDAEQ